MRPVLLRLIALEDFRRRLYSKHVMDTGHQDIEESGMATAPHPQNVQSSSIMAQLDLAITFSETALSAADRDSARRSMVFARQLLDGVEGSLDEGSLDCRAGAEIESRLDWLRLLLRQCNEAHRQREDKAIDTCPPSNGAAPEPGIERLPKDEPTEAVREVPAAEDVRRDPTESLNCHSYAMQQQALSEQTAWRSLIGLFDKFSAWLMTGVSYRLVLRVPWTNLFRWLASGGTRKRAPASKPRQAKNSVRHERRGLSCLTGIGSKPTPRARQRKSLGKRHPLDGAVRWLGLAKRMPSSPTAAPDQ